MFLFDTDQVNRLAREDGVVEYIGAAFFLCGFFASSLFAANAERAPACLLYTSDAADEALGVDL